MTGRGLPVNRTQGLVIGFFASAWLTLVVILTLSRSVRAATLRDLPGMGTALVVAFAVTLLVLLVLLSFGVVRRWRWLFWLLLAAFALGVLRVPIAALDVVGVMEQDGPTWYVVLQALVGLVQAGIAAAMFAGYRRTGPWGAW